MLERAARPIGVGPRTRHGIPDSLFHSHGYRLLHTPFRRHGTHELDCLSSTVSAVSLEPFFRSLQPAFSSSSASVQPQPISPIPWRDWHKALRQWNLPTSISPSHSATPLQNNLWPLSLRRFRSDLSTPKSTPPPSDTLLTLQGLIRNFDSKDQHSQIATLAWESFTALAEHEKSPALTQALIPVLASSDDTFVADQIVHLFEALDPIDREPFVYSIILARLLSADRVGKAVIIADAALDARISPSVAGIDALLQYLISHRQWQFVFHVFSKSLQFFSGNDIAEKWCDEIFSKISGLPQYSSHVLSLITTIQQFPNAISPETDPTFVNKAIASVFHRSVQGFGNLETTENVMATIADMRILQLDLFDLAVTSCLSSAQTSLQDRLNIAFNIYQRGWHYRGSFENPDLEKTPSLETLEHLLSAASEIKNKEIVMYLHNEWRNHFRVPSWRPSKEFIRAYARVGDLNAANQALDDFVAAIDTTDPDYRPKHQVVTPLLHAYAMRANPSAVLSLMDYMEQYMGLKPDIWCWNILIHAYQRDRDLEGALQAYSDVLSTGLNLDVYTFGPLMALCAKHGDLSLVKDLLRSAEQQGINPSPAMHDSVVLAMLNQHQLREAERYAASVLEKSNPQDCTYMYNLILHFVSSSSQLHDISKYFASIHRRIGFMRWKKIPLNTQSYSELMRAYVRAGQPQKARQVLDQMLDENFSVTAFEFSIMVDGYARTKQFDKAIKTHAKMLQLGISPNASSKSALIKLHSLQAKEKIIRDKPERGSLRLNVPQELLYEILQAPESESFWENTPMLGSSLYKGIDYYPATYFEFLLSLYEEHGAHDMIETLLDQLFRKASEVKGTPDAPIAFRILGSIMTHNYRKKDHTQVDKYWKKVMDVAAKFTITSQKILARREEGERRPGPLNSKPVPVMPMYRKMLTRPLDVYMRSLAARHLLVKIQETIDEIFSQGFELDNTNWNHYVNILAQHNLLEEAFTVTERRLVPLFEEQYKRRQAQQEQGVVLDVTNKKQQLTRDFVRPRAQYRTMSMLASKIRELKRSLWLDNDLAKGQILERLREIAPRTMQATTYLRMDAYGKPMVQVMDQKVKPFGVRDEYGAKIRLNSRKRKILRNIWGETPKSPEEHSEASPLADLPGIDPAEIDPDPFEFEPLPHPSIIFLAIYPRLVLNRKFSLPPNFWHSEFVEPTE